MVTVCATRFHIQRLYISVIVATNSNYYPVQRNWLVFLMEVGCVLCEIRCEFLTFKSVVVTLCAIRFNTKKFYIFLTGCVYVFYMVVRKKLRLFPLRH